MWVRTAQMKNPFASQTKGEMFVQVAQRIGRERAAKLLSRSHSCSRGDIRFAGVSGRSPLRSLFWMFGSTGSFRSGRMWGMPPVTS